MSATATCSRSTLPLRDRDDRGRLVGEDVWEPDPDRAVITRLDPADVLTTEEAAKLLDPWIQPLPSFDEMVLGRAPGL